MDLPELAIGLLLPELAVGLLLPELAVGLLLPELAVGLLLPELSSDALLGLWKADLGIASLGIPSLGIPSLGIPNLGIAKLMSEWLADPGSDQTLRCQRIARLGLLLRPTVQAELRILQACRQQLVLQLVLQLL